jgi:putative transposase
MHLKVNLLFEWQDGSVPPRIERILWIEQADSRMVTIDIQDKKAWPLIRDRTWLEEQIEAKALRLLEVDVYQHLRQPDDAFDPKHRQLRDQAYEVIRDIVEKHEGEIFFSYVLGPLVKKAVEAAQEKWRGSSQEERSQVRGRSKVAVYRYLRLYWQRGQMRNALLPAYDRCGAKGVARSIHGPKLGRPSKKTVETGIPTGVNITDEIKEMFRQGTKLFYDTPKKRGKEEAFERILARFFNTGKKLDPNGIPVPILPSVDEMPTFRQYQYWYNKEWDTTRSTIGREGMSSYNLRRRAALGSLRLAVPGPGFLYEIDATVADVYLVSTFHRRRVIGRPVIYIVIDVFSNLIAGVSVCFEGPSWIGAMLALENMALDKVSFCKEYGFDIEKQEWPSCGLPREILADRGELFSKNSDDLTNSLNIRMSTAAPYRPDWKGCVERHFRLLDQTYCSWIPGRVDDHPRRDQPDYRLDAKMTLQEFRKFIIDCVLEHNTTYRVPEDHLDQAFIKARIDPYPCNLWEWGISNRTGILHEVTRDELRLALLPKDEASVTREGLRFHHTRYTCDLAERENWFGKVRSGELKSWKVPIIYDPRALDHVYLRLDNGKGLEECKRIDKDVGKYGNCDWYDIDDVVELQAQRKRDAASSELQERVRHRARRDHLIEDATRKTNEAREEGETKADRTRDMKGEQLAERQCGREENRWDIAQEVTALVSPAREETTRVAIPRTSKAKRVALLQKLQHGGEEHV